MNLKYIMSTAFVLVLVTSVKYVFCDKMDGFIVGGAIARIEDHPHAAYVAVLCVQNPSDKPRQWLCGGSILNQVTILTAAHCFHNCLPQSKVLARVGAENRKEGFTHTAKSFYFHTGFHEQTIENDIALMTLKVDLEFGPKVMRVALMKTPPHFRVAQIAGWGRVDEQNTKTDVLKTTKQKLLPYSECLDLLKRLPPRTLCAGDLEEKDYVAQGDSGSALLIKGYIQVGIVSYRDPQKAKGIAVYTKTADYIDWIAAHSKILYCS